MAYRLVKDPQDVQVELLPLNSVTTVPGSLLERTAGTTTWALTTSSSDYFTQKAVAIEAVTSGTEVKAILVTSDQLWEADLTNNSSATHNGDRMAATDSVTVNNSASDVTGQAVVFVQDNPTGAAADKTSVGRILVGNGVDPDAS